MLLRKILEKVFIIDDIIRLLKYFKKWSSRMLNQQFFDINDGINNVKTLVLAQK